MKLVKESIDETFWGHDDEDHGPLAHWLEDNDAPLDNESENEKLRSLISKIYNLERNEVNDVSQIMEFDDPVDYIARRLNMPEVLKMTKQELRKDRALMDIIHDKVEQDNKKLYRQIDRLKNEVFKMYPLLKAIDKREEVPYDDNILDAQKLYKEGKTWIIVTPRYYNEATLSKEEVVELKRFIKDKGKK
jgi:hypothetical protein